MQMVFRIYRLCVGKLLNTLSHIAEGTEEQTSLSSLLSPKQFQDKIVPQPSSWKFKSNTVHAEEVRQVLLIAAIIIESARSDLGRTCNYELGKRGTKTTSRVKTRSGTSLLLAVNCVGGREMGPEHIWGELAATSPGPALQGSEVVSSPFPFDCGDITSVCHHLK